MNKKILILCLTFYIGLIVIIGYFTNNNDNENKPIINESNIVRYTLAPEYRLVNVTWRTPDDLWILSVEDTTVKPKTYRFTQKDPTEELQKIIYIEER